MLSNLDSTWYISDSGQDTESCGRTSQQPCRSFTATWQQIRHIKSFYQQLKEINATRLEQIWEENMNDFEAGAKYNKTKLCRVETFGMHLFGEIQKELIDLYKTRNKTESNHLMHQKSNHLNKINEILFYMCLGHLSIPVKLQDIGYAFRKIWTFDHNTTGKGIYPYCHPRPTSASVTEYCLLPKTMVKCIT